MKEVCWLNGCLTGQISQFPNTLLFVILCGMFWLNLMKTGQILILYKFAQWLYSSKNQMQNFRPLRFVNSSGHALRLSCPLKPLTNEVIAPPGFDDNRSKFPRKSNTLQTLFFFFIISITQWSTEDNNGQSCQTLTKRKICSQNGKTGKHAVKQEKKLIDTVAFKIMIQGDCNVFASRLVFV